MESRTRTRAPPASEPFRHGMNYAGSGYPSKGAVPQPGGGGDAHHRREEKHMPDATLSPTGHSAHQFNAMPSSKAAILGIPRHFPDLPIPPLSPSSSLMSSTRSTSPDFGYSYDTPLTPLPSVDDVLSAGRPSNSVLSQAPRTRTPCHSRQSMSMDSAVVLEMDSVSVKSMGRDLDNDEDDEVIQYEYQGPIGYHDMQDSAVSLQSDEAINQVQERLHRVTLSDPGPHFPVPVAVVDDESTSDDDTCTVVSDDDVERDTSRLLALSTPIVLGVNVEDLSRDTLERCRSATASFTRVLSAIVDQGINSDRSAGEQRDQAEDSGSNASPSGDDFSRSNSHSNSEKSGRGNNASRKRRRKMNNAEDHDNDEDEDLDVDGGVSGPQRRPCTGLRLRCLFRARNPIRFNVRDHYSCSMSYFTNFADLRQHIIKKHSREDPLDFGCPRCNKSYRTKKELEAHIRVPVDQVCELADTDIEDGIDSVTAKRIIDRRRPTSGPTDQDQWNDLWSLVFPEDINVPPYEFQAVVEHYELEATYVESLQYFQGCLEGLELSKKVNTELCERIMENFAMAMNKLNIRAREMDYVNRQSNRSSVTRPIKPAPSDMQPARDSGVFMETGSTRSNSFIRPASGTPVSSYEQHPLSSTGSFRSNQGHLVRRSSSVAYQQPRPQLPAHQLSYEILQNASHTNFNTGESAQPHFYPVQLPGMAMSQDMGHASQRAPPFMGLPIHNTTEADLDAFQYDENALLDIPYQLLQQSNTPSNVPPNHDSMSGFHVGSAGPGLHQYNSGLNIL